MAGTCGRLYLMRASLESAPNCRPTTLTACDCPRSCRRDAVTDAAAEEEEEEEEEEEASTGHAVSLPLPLTRRRSRRSAVVRGA